MKVIVPIKNKFDYIPEFQKTFKKDDLLFVFDRCQPPEGFDGNYKIHDDPRDCFLAGKVRDFGAEGIEDDIFFFDQDKCPDFNPERMLYDINDEFFDCIIFFQENDYRQNTGAMFFRDDYIGWKKYFDPQNFIYTCGIWLSGRAISAIRRLNKGRIFHPAFDGRWGEEDRFLGDELVALGFKIGYMTPIRLTETGVGTAEQHLEDFATNFGKRLRLRACLAPEFTNPKLRITWGECLVPNIEQKADELEQVAAGMIDYRAWGNHYKVDGRVLR